MPRVASFNGVPGIPSKERGNSLVEFALSFAVIFALFQGAYNFGYAFYLYNNLETAVRCGGRYAATRTYDSTSATPSSAYTTAVKNVVVYGSPAGGTIPVVPGLTPEKVRVRMTFIRNIPAQVTVDVVNHVIDTGLRSIPVNGKPVAVFPYLGRWDPVP